MLPLIKIVEAKLSHSEADGAQWRAGGGGGGGGGGAGGREEERKGGIRRDVRNLVNRLVI